MSRPGRSSIPVRRPRGPGRRPGGARRIPAALPRGGTPSPTLLLPLLLLLVLPLGCGDEDEPPARGPIDGPRNVLIVSFDTTRADALGCYGGARDCSPNVDALAAEGVVFEHAFSPAPMTLPSHTTLLTGLDPVRHRVRDNSVYEVPQAARTLAEELAPAGYHTIGVVAAIVLERRYGLDQGFEVYDDQGLVATPDRTRSDRRGGEIADAFLRHLDAAPEGPWLGFVHLFDPHQPYNSPPEYLERFGRAPEDQYFAEIAYADAQLGRILDRLKQRGEYENTLIVFTSDHGEGRGEHGEMTHSKLIHDATQRVPLILRHHRFEPRRVDDQLVNLVDVMPTVLDWVGVDSEQGMDGRSLLPLCEGGSLEAPGAAYMECLSPSLGYDFAPLDGVRTLDWKLVQGARARLYDVRRDPGELVDVSARHPEVLEDMQARLRQLRGRTPTLDATTREMSGAEREALGGMGYVAASTEERAAGDDRSDLPDPYDHMEDLDRYEAATQLIATQQPAQLRQAKALLEDLVARLPRTYQFREALGSCLGRLGRHTEALEQFRAAEQIHPESVDLWINIALASGASGDFETAREYLVRAVATDGAPPKASFLLAEIYRNAGNAMGAQGVIQELLKRDDISESDRQQAIQWMR